MNRTPIYAALISTLEAMVTAGAVKSVRRPKSGQDFASPPVVPCALVVGDKEIVSQTQRLPRRIELVVDIHLHADVPTTLVPADRIDALLEALDVALDPAPGKEVQTLGGIVHHCWIEGDIERFELLPGNRCLAIVPVHILVP